MEGTIRIILMRGQICGTVGSVGNKGTDVGSTIWEWLWHVLLRSFRHGRVCIAEVRESDIAFGPSSSRTSLLSKLICLQIEGALENIRADTARRDVRAQSVRKVRYSTLV